MITMWVWPTLSVLLYSYILLFVTRPNYNNLGVWHTLPALHTVRLLYLTKT